MTTRSGRRAATAEAPHLSHIEALLIAQGAWEMGTGSSTWPAIAKILSKHPLVTRPKSFFTAQSCHATYNNLMQEAGLEVNEESCAPQSATSLTLAQKHYQLRFDELHQLILAEENAFKTILNEIEEIKAGKWDGQITSSLTSQTSATQEVPVDTSSAAPAEPASDEVFNGSDLSGVTESSSPSQIREGSETPTLDKSGDHVPTESQPEPEPSQETVDEAQEQSTPTAPVLTEYVDVEPENGIPTEQMSVEPPATEDTVMVDEAIAQENDDNAEQPRQEEEEEEEEPIPEEEETHDDEHVVEEADEQESDEEATPSAEHQPEEEEEEARERNEELEEQADEKQPNMESPLPPSEDQEEQEAPGEVEKQAEEEASSEEPAHFTRRSTRNKPSTPAAPVTRKTRRQRRVSELDAPSDGENPDNAKVETPQDEERASSPVTVDPIGTRRRKRKSSISEPVASPRDRKRPRDESEPIDDDEGPGPSTGGRRRRGDRSDEHKKFQNVINMLHSQITQHRNGTIFHNPIRTVEAPDYHDIVKRPMDLKTIKARVKDGLIANSLEYQRDVYLMFANAMMYNRPGSDVYHMAEDMMHDSEGYINAHRQTEGLVRNRP